MVGKYKIIQYILWKKNADKHLWFYFPDLTREELILHKQFDSDTTKQGRMVFHTSVPDPTAPPNTPPRGSIEVIAKILNQIFNTFYFIPGQGFLLLQIVHIKMLVSNI